MESITQTIINLTPQDLEEMFLRVLREAQPNNRETSKPMPIEEAAEFATCAISTIRKAYRERRLIGHRQAGRLYFLEEDLKNWIVGK